MFGFVLANAKRPPRRGESWAAYPRVQLQVSALKGFAKMTGYELIGFEVGNRVGRTESVHSHPAFLRALQRARETGSPLAIVNIFEMIPPLDLERSMKLLERLEELDVPIISAIHGKWLHEISAGLRATNLMHFSWKKSEDSKRIREGIGKSEKQVHDRTPSRRTQKMGSIVASAKADEFVSLVAPMIDKIIEALPEKDQKSYRAIARALNEHKVPTRRGGKWHGEQVKRDLKRINSLNSKE